jgi:hypothetical protein
MNVILGWDSQLRIYPILDAVLAISRTREEQMMPRGALVFVERNLLGGIDYLAQFPEMEQPLLDNFKHVRKLLQAVEDSDRKLVSDGKNIVGITTGDSMPPFFITADFRGNFGFLRLNTEDVCSFSGGSFKSTTRKAKLVHVEEALLESQLDPQVGHDLFKIASDLVHAAEESKSGCTLVLDLNADPVFISGQKLADPLDLRRPHLLELARSLSRVDGALHIRQDLCLHGFACLLDGRAIPGEDRARGARFNSALRFTAQRPHLLVVVVSVDRPVAVIQEGVEISAQCQWTPVTSCLFRPLTLEAWIDGEKSGILAPGAA